MTFWEAIQTKFIKDNGHDDDNMGIQLVQRNRDALENYTAFLNGIPDDKKQDAFIVLIYINSYQAQKEHKPNLGGKNAKRAIGDDLKTVIEFKELFERSYFWPLMDGVSQYGITEFKECVLDYLNAMQGDLEILQNTTPANELKVILKQDYYKKHTTKEEIQELITQILRNHSQPIDFLSVRAFMNMI
jgi:hypothetical protein